MEDLNKAYNNKKLTLVLGAGVSVGCGLPNWNKLLGKLRKNIHFGNEDHTNQALVVDKIFFKLFNKKELILARNLHRCFNFEPQIDQSILFEKFVRCALYQGTKFKETKLLKELVRLSSFYKGEKFLDSVITYNYDDVLEYFLKKNDSKTPFESICFNQERQNNESLPIYHVHGFLPRNGNLTDRNKIVLSEEAYHYLYDNASAETNHIQSEKLKNNTCLLIGLSLNDPNLRRLLDATKKNRESHHIIMIKPNIKDIRRNLKKLLVNESGLLNEKTSVGLEFDDTVKMLRRLEEKFFDEDAFSLGVQTIWVENKEDIWKTLHKIKLEPDK